ncbi:PREDICTED: uncharacterized protein C1orf106 homolog [Dipodomys ordii]|uniref:Uncharacterized protein C1orf106 homolog n=1 Tax=Dipodomys ordii TaxID=10020 RepID=A0A1S3F882_DIPOR|nr:PREDICTED: uncharacterized protein C1orf106 homolog [Dipodomys ordii]
METKDEVSDTDSGIILQSGPDSPVSQTKELTHAVRKQQRALEARLEACLEELRRLCLREAELTGTLPEEYPLKPGEKPPKVRRRIGAAYRLDEWALRREDPQSGLERQLALQLQITEAARRLSSEDNLSRQARRQRKHAALQEEKKLRELQRCLGERRRSSEPPPTTLGRELSASDDSSLSDGLLLEEEDSHMPKPPPESPALPSRPLPPQSLEGLQPAGPEPGGLERAPIQNSPWKETSLDHPYEKSRKSLEPSSESSSPATTPQDGALTSSLWLLEPVPYHMVPIRSVPGQRQGRTSAPATPEMQGRRGQAQSLRDKDDKYPGLLTHGLPSSPPWQVPTVCVLRRSPEGAPVQVFVPENGEIISQVAFRDYPAVEAGQACKLAARTETGISTEDLSDAQFERAAFQFCLRRTLPLQDPGTENLTEGCKNVVPFSMLARGTGVAGPRLQDWN